MSMRTDAAPTKVEQISTAVDDSESEMPNGVDNAENASLSEESDNESGPNISEKGEPPTKREKFSVVLPLKQPAAPMKRGKKSLSLLSTMPLDILFEILGRLAPKDLLNVLRTNKLFRETLLATNAKTVWKHALEGAGAPECPSDLREPRWAKLLFRTSCENCEAKNIHKVDFFLRRRLCTTCKKTNLVGKSSVAAAFPDCDELVLTLIPSTNVGWWPPGCSSYGITFWRPDIEEMMRTIADYKRKKEMHIPDAQNEMATFIAQRMAIVNEIQSNEAKFSAWLSDVAIARQDETQQSMKRRQDAICVKFLELGYEEGDLSDLRLEKAFNQKASLSDSIWKRIRPILEPRVKTEKDRRIAIQMGPIKKTRRNLLDQLCTNYKYAISPPLWKYLPAAMELGEKEPFKALIDAKPDVVLTIDNFLPLMWKLPVVVTEIQNELKVKLIQKLADVSKADQVLPANCLDLATSVFRCKAGVCGSDGYVVGTDSILSHNCGEDTPHPSHSLRKGRTSACSRDFVLDSTAVTTARELVLCAGLDPEKAVASEMDGKDLCFACRFCANRGYSWRAALSHASAHMYTEYSCTTRMSPMVGITSYLNFWRVLSPIEAAFLKENEKNDPKWAAPKWSCSRCPVALREGGLYRDAVVQHVQTVHKIISPTVPTDLFYFEKVVTAFRQPDKMLYRTPMN